MIEDRHALLKAHDVLRRLDNRRDEDGNLIPAPTSAMDRWLATLTPCEEPQRGES